MPSLPFLALSTDVGLTNFYKKINKIKHYDIMVNWCWYSVQEQFTKLTLQSILTGSSGGGTESWWGNVTSWSRANRWGANRWGATLRDLPCSCVRQEQACGFGTLRSPKSMCWMHQCPHVKTRPRSTALCILQANHRNNHHSNCQFLENCVMGSGADFRGGVVGVNWH